MAILFRLSKSTVNTFSRLYHKVQIGEINGKRINQQQAVVKSVEVLFQRSSIYVFWPIPIADLFSRDWTLTVIKRFLYLVFLFFRWRLSLS